MLQLAFKVAEVEGSLASKAIAWWTKGPFSHVEMWLSHPATQASCFSSTMDTGTRFTTIDLLNPPGLWRTVAVPTTPQEDATLLKWCVAHANEKYDKLGIVGFVIPFGEHTKHEMFCSETACAALEACTAIGAQWLKDKDESWRTSPNKLYQMALASAAKTTATKEKAA